MAHVRLSSTMTVSSAAATVARTSTMIAAMEGNSGIVGTQIVSTTSALITQTSSFGCCLIRNLDSTNYVEWGPDDSGTIRVLGRIQPGEYAMGKMHGATRVQTAAGTALIEVVSLDR